MKPSFAFCLFVSIFLSNCQNTSDQTTHDTTTVAATPDTTLIHLAAHQVTVQLAYIRDIEGWHTYTNEKNGIAFKYPPSWRVENSEDSILVKLVDTTWENKEAIIRSEQLTLQQSNACNALTPIETEEYPAHDVTITTAAGDFQRSMRHEGAAGTVYMEVWYVLPQQNGCWKFRFVTARSNILANQAGNQSNAPSDAALLKEMDTIVATFLKKR